MFWRLWDHLNNASQMIQQTRKHCNNHRSTLLREILFHWRWQVNWFLIFRTKSQDNWTIWTQHNAVLIRQNAEFLTLKILSIIYNQQWRKTIQITQQFARLHIRTLKFTIANDDDSSHRDNELTICETRFNDEVWDFTTTIRRMFLHLWFDDTNLTTENSQIAIDVVSVFLTTRFLYLLVEHHNDNILLESKRNTTCSV